MSIRGWAFEKMCQRGTGLCTNISRTIGIVSTWLLGKVKWITRSLTSIGSLEDVDQVFGKCEAAHDFYIRLLMYGQRNEVV